MKQFSQKKLVLALLVFFLILLFVILNGGRVRKSSHPNRIPSSLKSTWQESLRLNLKALEPTSSNKSIGLYVKNLKTGQEFSLRGDESWYIASGIKLPVALAVLRSIDTGTLTFETKIEVLESDYIDGAGELNFIKPGSHVSIRLLLDQALTYSDNTATDILIRHVGLEKINALTNFLAPRSFSPITTLVDVRREAFSNFHPDARFLPNMEYIRIKTLKDPEAKLEHLAKVLKINRSDLKHQSLESAFEAYYSKKLNSATLRGYGQLFEKLNKGEILKEKTHKHLLDILERVATGEKRIKAGLPKSYIFAHKTGTQYKRYCDMGMLKSGSPQSDQVIVVACVRNEPLEKAEKIFRQIGQALHQSGVIRQEAK